MILQPTAETVNAIRSSVGESLPVVKRKIIVAMVKDSIKHVYDERVADILETLLYLIETKE